MSTSPNGGDIIIKGGSVEIEFNEQTFLEKAASTATRTNQSRALRSQTTTAIRRSVSTFLLTEDARSELRLSEARRKRALPIPPSVAPSRASYLDVCFMRLLLNQSAIQSMARSRKPQSIPTVCIFKLDQPSER